MIPGDYHTQITNLLRYPNLHSLGAAQTSNAPALLLSQAQLLLMSSTPGTGVSLVMQNRGELGIPVDIPDLPSPPVSHRRASGIAATFPQGAVQGRSGHERPRLQDMITSRIMDANETLGIQRGFLSTISELRVCFLTPFELYFNSLVVLRKISQTSLRRLFGHRHGTGRPYRLWTSARTSQSEALIFLLPTLKSEPHGHRNLILMSSVSLPSYACC